MVAGQSDWNVPGIGEGVTGGFRESEAVGIALHEPDLGQRG